MSFLVQLIVGKQKINYGVLVVVAGLEVGVGCHKDVATGVAGEELFLIHMVILDLVIIKVNVDIVVIASVKVSVCNRPKLSTSYHCN